MIIINTDILIFVIIIIFVIVSAVIWQFINIELTVGQMCFYYLITNWYLSRFVYVIIYHECGIFGGDDIDCQRLKA